MNEKIGLSKRSLCDFLRVRKDNLTLENFKFLRFYKAWARSGLSHQHSIFASAKILVRWRLAANEPKQTSDQLICSGYLRDARIAVTRLYAAQ